MSNYTKTTDFEAKDSLPSGNTGKIIRGSEFETEFDNISTAIATKADLASPTFSGTINITSASINDGSVTISGFLDEDTMATNSASHVPTQQSVKAYVDSQTAGIVTDTDTQTLTNKTLTSPVINTGVSGTAVLDEDDMFSDSDTKLATQQSIKAYVDSQTASVSLTGIDDNATGTRLIVSDDGIAVGNTGANPTAVNGTIAVNATASSGAEFIAGTNDTVISSGAFMGGYIFKNADSTGTPPHYAGLWAESADTSGNMNLYFAAGSTGYETGSPDLTIDSIGNVGIGTDTPEDILNYRTLEIRGVDGASIELGADTTKHGSLYSGAWGVSLSALGSRELQFRTNGAERVTINSTGMVGVGEDSPTARLHVTDSSGGGVPVIIEDTGESENYIRFIGSTTTNGPLVGGHGNDFVVGVESQEKLRITNSDVEFDDAGTVRMSKALLGQYLATGTYDTSPINVTTASSSGTTYNVVKFGGSGNNAEIGEIKWKSFGATAGATLLCQGGNTVIELRGQSNSNFVGAIINGTLTVPNLPTLDPLNAGQLWNDSGTLKVSAG